MTPTLTYRSLNRSAAEIRLIKIIPQAKKPSGDTTSQEGSDLVACQLQHFPLGPQITSKKEPLDWEGDFAIPSSDHSKYWRYKWGDFVALSYTWGDPHDTTSIVVNGHLVAVRTNLGAALRALRDKRPIQKGIWVWIDALCINQDDVGERNEEVKRMRAIYGTARDVVVWLGPEQNESGLAMNMIKQFADSYKNKTDQELGEKLRVSPSLFGVGSWRALGQLLNRPYWDRVWIMQEIAMGNSQTPILCGDDMVRWGDVYHGIFKFGTRFINLMFTCIEKECKDSGVKYSGLNRNKIIHLWDEQIVQAGTSPPQLMAMLDLSRKSLATDSRDKVYGLMGLMPLEVARLIQPDYEQALPKIYTSFAKSLIIATRSLEILEQCTSHAESNSTAPSWAPDWTNKNHFRLFSGRSCYHAAFGTASVISFNDDDTRLSVQGFKIGEIDGLGASYYESHRSTGPGDLLVQSTEANNPYGSDANFSDTVWKTLTGNRSLNGKLAPSTYRSLLQCPLALEDAGSDAGVWRGRKAFCHLLAQNRTLNLAGKPLGSFFPKVGTADPEGSRHALERIFRFHRSRRLMVTRQGHLGLVPIATRKSDSIYILLGCNVPMVLRSGEDNCYQVVGGCYLHGFMEGEAKRDAEAEMVQYETITLN